MTYIQLQAYGIVPVLPAKSPLQLDAVTQYRDQEGRLRDPEAFGVGPSQEIVWFLFSSSQVCVAQVTVQWDDEVFKFCETHEHLDLTDVAPRIIQVYENNVGLWSSSAGEYHWPSLNYPV